VYKTEKVVAVYKTEKVVAVSLLLEKKKKMLPKDYFKIYLNHR